MSRALITGGAGFVGANLVRRLLGAGWEVHVLVRPGSDRWRLATIRTEVRVHAADIVDAEQVYSVVARIAPTHVFHLAAHGSYSWQIDSERILATNMLGTLHLLDAGSRHGCEAFVNTGSSSEYGFKSHAPSEDELPKPNSDYGVAKAAATMLARYRGQEAKMRISTLRLYSVYGPFEAPGRLLPTLALAARGGRVPPLVDPTIARDFVYVDDVIDAYLVASERAGGGEIYNVGTGIQTSLAELIEIAGDVFSFEPKPRWGTMPARSWDTTTWVADPAKIRRDLGWLPRTTLSDGLRALGEWFAAASADLRARYGE